MFKFNEKFYKELKQNALLKLGGYEFVKNVPNRNILFAKWLERLVRWNSGKTLVKGIASLRTVHDKIKCDLMRSVEKNFDPNYTLEVFSYMSEVSVCSCRKERMFVYRLKSS